MPTHIRLTPFKSSDEKEQEFLKSENRYEAEYRRYSSARAFEEIGGEVVQSVAFVLEKGE